MYKPSGTIIRKRLSQHTLRFDILQKRHSPLVHRVLINGISAVLLGIAVFFTLALVPFWKDAFRQLFVYHDYGVLWPLLLDILPLTLTSGVVGYVLFMRGVFDRQKPVNMTLSPQTFQVIQPDKSDTLRTDSLRGISLSTQADTKGYPISQITVYPTIEAEPLQFELKLTPEERDRLAQDLNAHYAAICGNPLPVDVH